MLKPPVLLGTIVSSNLPLVEIDPGRHTLEVYVNFYLPFFSWAFLKNK